MQTVYINTAVANGRKVITDFLKQYGIDAKHSQPDERGFCRTIEFQVYGIQYKIIWFVNQSTLEIGGGERPAQIPFKYIYLDTTFPLVRGNKSLGFSYSIKEDFKLWESPFPYEVFRLPLEIE